MKQIIRNIALLFLIVVFVAPATYAQPAETDPEIKTLHDSLRQVKSAMEAALTEGDIEGILEFVDDEIVFTAMNADVARGKDGIKAYFAKMMVGPDRIVDKINVNIEVDELSILHGADTAIAFGDANDEYILASGSEILVKARWSATLVKSDERWVVAAFHYSTNLFDNAVLAAQRQYLIIAGIAFALLAAGLFFFIGRRAGLKNS